MTFETFESWRPSASSMKLVEQAQRILDSYQGEGYTLSVRQLYYQFVARGLLENTNLNYKNLIKIVSKARLSGRLSWSHIEDRSRSKRLHRHFKSPAECLRAAVEEYRIDKWFNQAHHVEVWVEKEALIDVVGKVCSALDVTHFACKGYGSQSELYAAGKRLEAKKAEGKHPVILHLGDHDPSGMDMTDDIENRLSLFARHRVDVRRLALNMDQVEQYAPPPNPTKTTDARTKQYTQRFGSSCWELDALEPSVIGDLISTSIHEFMDPVLWRQAIELEQAHKRDLAVMANV